MRMFFPAAQSALLPWPRSNHPTRQELEKSRIDAGNRTEHRGQIFAFIIALAAILGGVYLISIGKDASGLTAIIAALAGLVGAFVYGKYTQAREREQKRRAFESRKAGDQQLELFEGGASPKG